MPPFSVLVVDNLPDGRARAVVERHRAEFRWPLHFVEEPERGIAQARNRAVTEAMALGAEWIAFIDDDDLPRPDWLWWLVRRQQETGASVVFGGFRFEIDGELPPRVARLRTVRRLLNWQPEEIRVRADGVPSPVGTGNVLLNISSLEYLRLADGHVFDPEMPGGSGLDVFIRLIKRGESYALCRESIVDLHWMVDRWTIRGLMKRYFRIGRDAELRRSKVDLNYSASKRMVRLMRKMLIGMAKSPHAIYAGDLDFLIVASNRAGKLISAASKMRIGRFSMSVVNRDAASRSKRPAASAETRGSRSGSAGNIS